MGIQVAIRHHTKYIYDRPVNVWPQVIRLRPAPHSRTKISAYSLNVSPKEHFLNWMQDPFGNYQARVNFEEKVKEFVIDVEIIADLVTINPFDFFVDDYAQIFPFDYDEKLKKELLLYLDTNDANGPLMGALFAECQKYKGENIVDFLVALNTHIYQALDYTIRMEPGVQKTEVTMQKSLGSCRDFAWVFVQLLRKFGLAARFVSGYLVQLTPDIKSIDGPVGPSEDFTDLHAWAEVYVPGAGWIGLDATSGLFAGEGHIPLACTPNPESAAPVTGATEITSVGFEYNNKVERILEKPRVTKPYTSAEWQRIINLGHVVDQMLTDGDVRLTMGGEPTFISLKDMESEQWNTEADGKDKRVLALKLTDELKAKFAPHGLIHFGQGKWYPGEPIPRWQYAIYWRKDGGLMWEQPSLLGDPNVKENVAKSMAKTFLEEVAKRLGLATEFVVPTFEDKLYYEWEALNLPHNFDKDKDSDKQTSARKALVEIMNSGIDEPAGYILPLRQNLLNLEWESCFWKFKRDRLYLIPGNSQMGYRLPFDRLVVAENPTDEIVVPANHFEENIALISRDDLAQKINSRITKTSKIEEINDLIRTTLCAEVKNGNLHVFMPPLDDINHFLELVYAVEQSSIHLKIPVIIEGYQAPYHPDVVKLGVTPDPGVVEVNVHPATNWEDIVHTYDELFEAAEISGLGTNKFMLDGKHMGTGGGNHITMGGVAPKDSPILRRPDLLRSMITFWQNHPGLSYLFSSPFIGPTSQAPRVDEGRPDIIYELDIAFKELDNHENPPFWMVDRIFRNLLIDITGNTHRAEFCIDKLYNPESETGRLGILELRGFDMPPHKEMCLVQLLLIRSLIAAFWDKPYKNKLINWGTDLHNKFMMHQFVKEDMFEVVDYLNNQGIPFEKEWLEVFLEFKFPVFGHINLKGINMTLRAAIEPWIVLGQEMTSSGTARYVDSSVERLEVLVEDFNPERYSLLCNLFNVPLVSTEYKGKYVASIRYKAWAPHSALHPTIEVNSPLIFDIYDTWNDRSIGGCTYHVVHPGGRSYDTFPVNSLEAESRRMTRFWEFNHNPKNETKISTQEGIVTTGLNYVTAHNTVKKDVSIKQMPISHEFPHTLDLRRG